MDRNDLYKALGEVGDDILERSEGMPNAAVPVRRRISVALVAAMLAVFLMGAGVVAAVYGDSIQSWFSHYWETVTGQEMSQGQSALIDHLSQKIGVTETANGLTVTVDSATAGDNSFYLLIRVEGMEFSQRHSYGFDEAALELEPDPMEGKGGQAGYGIELLGIDGDGAALLLLSYDYATNQGLDGDTSPLDVQLTLRDFAQDRLSDRRKLLAEGEWSFAFTIQRNRPESVQLPDTQVMAIDLTETERYAETPVTLTDIEVTNTGLRFQLDDRGGECSVDSHIWAVLKNGSTIGIDSGSGTRMESGELFCAYTWLIPVDLAEVAAVRIGGVDIPLP